MKQYLLFAAFALSAVGAMAQGNPSNTRHRGLDFNVDMGYDIPTKSGQDGCPEVNLSVGKRFSETFYWGVGAGIQIPTSGGDPNIPIFTEAKMYFPLQNSKLTPFATLNAGYVLRTKTSTSIMVPKSNGKGSTREKIELPDFVQVGIMPGISYPLSGGCDFSLSAGYAHYIPTKSGDSFGAVLIRAGFDFHKNVNKDKRPPVPTRDSGLQLTVEADAITPWNMGSKTDKFGTVGGNVIVGYKFNPNLSAGVGYGASWMKVGGASYSEIVKDADGNLINNNEDGYRSGENEAVMHKIFVRGQYRLNDKRFSPIGVLDLGLRLYSWSDENEVYKSLTGYNSSEYDGTMVEPLKSGFFVAPAVGFSLRTTNNSYFEMKVGYEFAKGLKEGSKTSTQGSYNPRTYTRSLGKRSLSGMFVTIGWTHTFGARAKGLESGVNKVVNKIKGN